MKKTLSIIIPAFNEESRLGGTIRSIADYVRRNGKDYEIIVVDDGSTDATSGIAAEALAEFPDIRTRVIRYDENRGKGFAVRKGLAESDGEIAVFTDADLSTPIEELPKLVEPIDEGLFDVTFGSRALDRSLIGTRQPWRREQGGKVFNFFVRALTGLPFWDTQCGFKAFDMEKFRPLLDRMTIDRFGFDVEFLYAAQVNGLRLKEIPVRWNNCEGTKVNIFRDSLRMFDEVRRIRKNGRLGQYKVSGER